MGIDGRAAYEAIRAHCLSKTGAAEEYPWGHVVWKVKGKLFCIASENETRLTVKSTPEKQTMLIQHPKIEVASHVGRYGWVTVYADDQDTLDLALELVDESYAMLTAKKASRK